MKIIDDYIVNGHQVYYDEKGYYYLAGENPEDNFRVSVPPPPPLEKITFEFHEIDQNLKQDSSLVKIDPAILPALHSACSGPLPSDNQLIEKFSYRMWIKNIEYIPTANNVFIITFADNNKIVIKPLMSPEEEFVGSYLAAEAGVNTPDFKFFKRASELGKALECIFEKCMTYPSNKEKLFSRNQQYLMVMAYVPGITLEDVKDVKDVRSLVGETNVLQDIVDQIGLIAAIDCLFYYNDRTPIFSELPNYDNLKLVGNEYGAIRELVALDSLMRLTRDENKFLFDKSSPVEEVMKMMEEIMNGSAKYGERLWNTLPEPLKQCIEKEFGENKGRALIVDSLKKGVIQVSQSLTPSVLMKVIDKMKELGLVLNNINRLSKVLEDINKKYSSLEWKSNQNEFCKGKIMINYCIMQL